MVPAKNTERLMKNFFKDVGLTVSGAVLELVGAFLLLGIVVLAVMI